jgi:hypothetical protein
MSVSGTRSRVCQGAFESRLLGSARVRVRVSGGAGEGGVGCDGER